MILSDLLLNSISSHFNSFIKNGLQLYSEKIFSRYNNSSDLIEFFDSLYLSKNGIRNFLSAPK